uniref:Uncharacterized protein n=1 Tax=Gorilla gorilla gorilla TaxID=9595 RepID=A0A2I2YAC1_GORGO
MTLNQDYQLLPESPAERPSRRTTSAPPRVFSCMTLKLQHLLLPESAAARPSM